MNALTEPCYVDKIYNCIVSVSDLSDDRITVTMNPT